MDNFLISGLVEFISESSEKYIGYSPEDIQGNKIFNYIHPSDHSRFGCHLMHQQVPPTSSTDPDKAKRNFTCRFKVSIRQGKRMVKSNYKHYTTKDLMAGIEEVRKGNQIIHLNFYLFSHLFQFYYTYLQEFLYRKLQNTMVYHRELSMKGLKAWESLTRTTQKK